MSAATDKPKKVANLQTFMLSQDYLPDHWNWNNTEKNALNDCAKTAQVIADRFAAQGITFIEAYAISHDRDEQEIWDKYENRYITSLTNHHIHFIGKLSKEDAIPLERIADIIGVEPEHIERPKAGRYAYDNMLSYIIHIKYPSKFRYDPHDVITLCGKNYIEYFRENHKTWTHTRYIINKEDNATIEDIESMIIGGNITMEDILFNPKYEYIGKKYYSRIQALFSNLQEFSNRQKGSVSKALHINVLKVSDNDIEEFKKRFK